MKYIQTFNGFQYVFLELLIFVFKELYFFIHPAVEMSVSLVAGGASG